LLNNLIIHILVKTIMMISISNNSPYKELNIAGGWHLAYYLPANRGVGTIARKILEFKNNCPTAIEEWSNWAGSELNKLDIKFDYIVRALGSAETIPLKGKPCSLLGRNLAKILNANYAAMAISKLRETKPLHKLSNRSQREEELKGIYKAHPENFNFNNKNILIIDDVTTASITITEIVRAIKEAWPNANLYFFCLGKTSYDDTLNDHITKKYFTNLI
jgi:hypothetical protein